jgi:hypothetical protein
MTDAPQQPRFSWTYFASPATFYPLAGAMIPELDPANLHVWLQPVSAEPPAPEQEFTWRTWALMLACLGLGVTGEARTVAIICAAVPPASSAYILARQLGGDATLMATLITVLTLVSVFTVLIFFFFSLEHKKLVGSISRVGLFFIMVSFGASFGYTVMARISLLIGRFQFLIDEWIKRTILGI